MDLFVSIVVPENRSNGQNEKVTMSFVQPAKRLDKVVVDVAEYSQDMVPAILSAVKQGHIYELVYDTAGGERVMRFESTKPMVNNYLLIKAERMTR